MIIDGNVLCCFSIHYNSQTNTCLLIESAKQRKGYKDKCNDLKGNEFAGKIQGKVPSCKLSFI